MHTDQQCKRCSRPIAGDQVIRLWDGHGYCRLCVEDVSPELLRYARSHAAIEETAQFDRGDMWRSALRMEFLIVAIFGAFFCSAGYGVYGPVGIIYGLAMTVVVCGAQAATQLPVFLWIARRMLPTVIVKDGNIECFRGGKKSRWFRSAPLESVSWRVGKSRQDSRLRSALVPRQNVVLLLLPLTTGRFPSGSERYACGWTDEMRCIWIAFLTLANVPRVG